MTTAWYCERFGVEPSYETYLACVYLEARGLVFLQDFRFADAEEIAEKIYSLIIADSRAGGLA